MKRLFVPAIALSVLMSACNGYDVATRVVNIIAAVLQVAAAETAAVPAADQPAYKSFVVLGQTLESQLQTCLEAADSGMKRSGKFLACFNNFTSGLTAPAELAQLRVLAPDTQKQVQRYLTAITVGVNVAVAAYGGTQSSAPSIAPAPTKAELDQLTLDAHLDQRMWRYVPIL